MWILFSLPAALAWAITNVTDKYILSKVIKQPIVALLCFALVGFAGSLIIFFTKGFSTLPPLVMVMAVLTGCVYLFANLLYFKAVQTEEVSRVISLLYLDPLFTAVLSAIFLSEIFSFAKYIGILLTVGGAVLVSYKKDRGFVFSKAIIFCILAAFLYAVYNLLLKYSVDRGDFWTVFAYIRLGTFLSLLPFYYFYSKPLLELAKQVRGLAVIVFSDSLALLGILFFAIATSIGYVTLTTSLTAIQPFVVLALTLGLSLFYPHILKEEQGRRVFFQKLLAIVLMFVGVLLITK